MPKVSAWERVEAGDGVGFDAYVARGESPNGEAIVLLQEIFGVNEWVRETTEWAAAQGFYVAAPDLFWRLQPRVDLGSDKESVKKAFSLSQRFDDRTGAEDVASTVRHIRATSPGTRQIHLIGFCLGGRLAVLGADNPDVASAISFYGVGIERNLDALERARCPLQLHYGGKDKFIPSPAVETVRQASAGRDIDIFVYPEANHGFFSNARLSYDPEAAELAWSRCSALMRRVATA